jgi:L-seryl-tRNA(Ser) seleniumtransferase
MTMAESPLRGLPSVHDVLASSALAEVQARHDHQGVRAVVRLELEGLRARVRGGQTLDGEATVEAVAARVAARLASERRQKLLNVINATGIVLHTNLGRAPLADEAALAAYRAGRGYLNLELDLETGKRSSRQNAVRSWLCQLTGAAGATVVNNNAAATILALRALAAGKEVILSRGQMIEIGGSFRIPEILAVSGAILKEVGTTNITLLSDYERAIGPNSGALLRIHPSNYRIRGFTKSVGLPELVELGRSHQLPVVDDVGSGAFLDLNSVGVHDEPIVRDSIATGADLVLCSGDKLLGGPQAGILVGRHDLIQKMEIDPLMRAFRLDKMTLAALEATLRLYLSGESAWKNVPVLRMLSASPEELHQRALRLAGQLSENREFAGVEVKPGKAYAGGGSSPDQELPSWCVHVRARALDEDSLARELRLGQPAVVARIQEGCVCFDLRTIFPEQTEDLVQALLAAVRSKSI